MKTLFKLPISMLFFLVLVSCSGDSPNEPQVVTPRPNLPGDVDENTGGNNNGSGGNNDPYSNPFFGMLDGGVEMVLLLIRLATSANVILGLTAPLIFFGAL